MVRVTVEPGETVPQLIEDRGIVQAGSLKTPRFMAVMVPFEGSVWLTVIAPAVTMISIMLAMPIAISAADLVFLGAIFVVFSRCAKLIYTEY